MIRVDSKRLEKAYTELVGMGPDMVTTLWSAIEKVKNDAILLKTYTVYITLGSPHQLHKRTPFLSLLLLCDECYFFFPYRGI